MLPLVEIPDIVRHYTPFFSSVFSPQAFQQFQRYVSGLIVSENKTVDGINRLFVLDVRNQTSLNRFLKIVRFPSMRFIKLVYPYCRACQVLK